MTTALPDAALDLLFREARSYNRWSDAAVPARTLRALYDLLKMGPTSANCSPARFVFVASAGGRERLAGCVSAGNAVKVRQAPVTAIIGMDELFHDRIPELFPHNPGARNWFLEPALRQATAFRNSSLQGAYLMLAARALGLDCGPMSGFDHDKVDAEFFAGTSVKSNFLCALGHGTTEELYPRSPRLAFDDACQVV